MSKSGSYLNWFGSKPDRRGLAFTRCVRSDPFQCLSSNTCIFSHSKQQQSDLRNRLKLPHLNGKVSYEVLSSKNRVPHVVPFIIILFSIDTFH